VVIEVSQIGPEQELRAMLFYAVNRCGRGQVEQRPALLGLLWYIRSRSHHGRGTFSGVVINAMVDSIAPASGSQFSLLPPDNATGNFTKVAQRIPVKLRIASDNPLAGKLRPGMSVIATILTDTTPPPP
jgi:hypothetical protein